MKCSIVENKDGSYTYYNNAPYTCANGITIPDFYLQFETYGNAANPVVIVNHALSTGCHLRSTSSNSQQGWWEQNVADGASVDTKKFFVICISNLGGNFGSSNAAVDKNFPSLSVLDVVNTQIMVLDALNITNIHAIIGNSIGGFISLLLAIKLADRVEKLITISSAAKAYDSYKKNHKEQRDLITNDPEWFGGNYVTKTFPGMLAARRLGLLTYIDLEELKAKLPSIDQRERYLNYNALKFCKTFDPLVYVRISEMVSDFDCDRLLDQEKLSFKNLTAKTTIISVTTDMLFPPQQQQDLYNKATAAGVLASLITIESVKGHDAFYTDSKIAEAIKLELDS